MDIVVYIYLSIYLSNNKEKETIPNTEREKRKRKQSNIQRQKEQQCTATIISLTQKGKDGNGARRLAVRRKLAITADTEVLPELDPTLWISFTTCFEYSHSVLVHMMNLIRSFGHSPLARASVLLDEGILGDLRGIKRLVILLSKLGGIKPLPNILSKLGGVHHHAILLSKLGGINRLADGEAVVLAHEVGDHGVGDRAFVVEGLGEFLSVGEELERDTTSGEACGHV